MRKALFGRPMFGVFAVLLATTSVTAGAAWAAGGSTGNHCISPEGVDGNELFGVSEQIVADGAPPEAGCGSVRTGESYIPLIPGCWTANSSWEVMPADYTPAAATPVEDFLSKVRSVTYVVDAGTRHTRSYRFRAQDIVTVVRERDLLPISGTDALWVCFLAKLPPLPPGGHTSDEFVELSARTCDDFGAIEADHGLVNCFPAGTTQICRIAFPVLKGPALPHGLEGGTASRSRDPRLR